MKTSLLLFICAGFLIVSVSCGGKVSDAEFSPENEVAVYDITHDAEIWADSIAKEMSLEEQAAQLLMPAIYARSDELTLNQIIWYIKDLKVGGLLLLKGDAYSASIIADTIDAIGADESYFPGVFIAIDAETGLAMRFSDAPKFPWNSKISGETDEQTFYDYGREIGRECRIVGINMILGPVIDVDRGKTRNGIMKKRSLGTDQNRVTNLGEAYGKGIESQKVISVAKHFPGHGATGIDTHKRLAGLTVDAKELDSIDIKPFKNFSDNGLSGIMVGHIWAQALDSVMRPASFSPIVIKDILKGKLGFRGLILVDAVGMGGAAGYTGVDAIKAGADIIIAPPNTEKELQQIVIAVKKGKLSRKEVFDRCRRVLFYKYLFDIPFVKRKESGIENNDVSEFLFLEADSIISRL